MNNPVELSLEAEFAAKAFESQVQQMSHDQAKEFLIQLYRQFLVNESLYKGLIKKQWFGGTTPEFSESHLLY